MSETLSLDAVVWDPSIYPRAKWSTSTIERYVDALEAGDEFPPVIVEEGTMRLLDGKHRLEAHKKAERPTILVQQRPIPEGMSAKRYAAMLSARHGDRMSNADLKALALEEAESDPKAFKVSDFVREMGVGESTVYDWVGHILAREREQRRAQVLRLTLLGWTQVDIATALGVSQPTVSEDGEALGIQRGRLNIESPDSVVFDIRRLLAERLERHEVARRFNLSPVLVEAIRLYGSDDRSRLKGLDVKVQPYDVWQFPSCHDLMGDEHPGRIPGELICHALYFLTDPGDLVVDPMAGSGTTLDACLLMGRKARGYDIDHRHDRIDVESHNLADGWPDTVGRARLIFWDPPYFDKMDHGTIGEDGYIEGSISGLDPDAYLDWFSKRFEELYAAVQPGTRLAFLMSDWDPENAKQHGHHRGIYLWDYADRLRDAGWTLKRQIQCPLSTQQVHPDIVNKFREARRLARLERYLLVGEA